ncbi:hypothetical protein SAMN04489712_105124 [Thermomonospora echinospora]|uniref:DivIVA domain-containing protein n=1 Tax=Thermomonospora echinospora TaxID=1992 RepID=A0A1H6A3A3_9ACTN|nr:hypothetical protein [Thermomonospora echinospora]SEG42226.1 hypothetical protein SAMN04489712_105124 [Thermomonospora echinospora]
MLVVLALAGLAVLAAVVVLAMGRGGELTEVHADHPPLRMPTGRRLTGTDVALLRLPHGIWGYQVDVTDEVLHRLAYALSERDARVAALEAQLAELHYRPARHDDPGPWDDPQPVPWEEAPAGDRHDDPDDGEPAAESAESAEPAQDDDLVGRHAGDLPGAPGKEAG